MQITYLVSQFPKLSETFVLGQITGLIDRGHDVEIISLTKPTEEIAHEDVNKYGLLQKTHYINKSPSSLGFELNERIVSLLMFTDLIHAHFVATPADWAQTISTMFNIPFIITAHAYDIFIDPEPDILKKKFDQSTKVITISEYNEHFLLELLGRDLSDKIEVIRCGIDLEDFPYVERKPGKTVKILTVGRLVEKKGITYAIEAFSKIQERHQNTELRIIGDGPLKDEISGRIAELKLEDKIVMLGEQTKLAVIHEMMGADIFFLPSLTAENGDREGIPVSIIEAQATGLPVASTVHSGIPEAVVEGKSGFLVPEKDTEAMAERLITLITNPELRIEMGKTGRSHVEKYFDQQRELDQLEELFKNTITYNKLLSDMPETQLNTIKQRAKLVGDLLSKLDSEIRGNKKIIKQKENEIKQNVKEIKSKDNEIKQKNEEIYKLQTHLDYIQSTTAYKIYMECAGVVDRIKKLIGTILPK